MVRWLRSFLAATVTTCTSYCLCGLPWIAPCKPCATGTEEACRSIGRSYNFKKFQCALNEEYNDLASLFFNTNATDIIRNHYSAGTDDFHFSSMLVFFGASYFLGIFSYGLALPVWSFCASCFNWCSLWPPDCRHVDWVTVNFRSWPFCCSWLCSSSWWINENDRLSLCYCAGSLELF
jgi:hypothetical protein